MSNTLQSSKSVIPLPEGTEVDKLTLDLVRMSLATHTKLYAQAENKTVKVIAEVRELDGRPTLVTEVIYNPGYQVFVQATVGGVNLSEHDVYGLAVDGKIQQTGTKDSLLAKWDELDPEHQEKLQRLFDRDDE